MTYDLDHAYCYFRTSVLGAFLRLLSHRRLADRVLVACLCYNHVDFISGEKLQNYMFSEPVT
jgi:intergrase/recombinase